MSKVLNEDDIEQEGSAKESMVGTKLSAHTTRKVIILVLIMLLAQPLQDIMTYMTMPDSYSHGLVLIYKLGGGSTTNGIKQFDYFVDLQSKLEETPLIAIKANHNGASSLEWQND